MSVFSCKETVRLVSQSLDQRLTLGQRGAVYVHLALCPMCSRFRRQLLLLRDAAHKYEEASLGAAEAISSALSPEARARFKQVLGNLDH